jgi:hypothetical protein
MKQRFLILATVMVQIMAVHAQRPPLPEGEEISIFELKTDFGETRLVQTREKCYPTYFETDRYGFYFTKPIVGDDIVFNLMPRNPDCWWDENDIPKLGDISFKVGNNTSNATKLIIKGSTGNVGINTTNPVWQFDVNGNMGAKKLWITNTEGAWGIA